MVYPSAKFKAQSKYFVFCKINSDNNPDLAKQYQVTGLPSLKTLKADGSVTHSWAGFSQVDQFVAEMDKGR